MLLELIDRFASVGSLSDQLQVRLVRQEGGDSLAEEEVIVNREHANRGAISAHQSLPCLRIRRNKLRRREGPYATEPGMRRSTSVPAPTSLHRFSSEPICWARSRMFVKPQCSARTAFNCSRSMPFPSSLKPNRTLRSTYVTTDSMC